MKVIHNDMQLYENCIWHGKKSHYNFFLMNLTDLHIYISLLQALNSAAYFNKIANFILKNLQIWEN